MEQEKKERDQLEQHLSKVQEEQGQAIIDLHKKLGKHVKDMHTWKDFLEQDKEYDSIDLHISMAQELKDETFEQKVSTVSDAFNEETEILQKLLLERRPKESSDNDDKGKKNHGKGKKI